jgi:opacity protein-like surface antigen
MKQYLLLTIFFCLFCGLISAQTESGTILLGGGVSFETSDNTSVFRASPNVGIFIMNDVAASATFSLFAGENTTSWALGPSIRLYLFGNEKGKLITQVGVNVGGAKNSDTDFGFELGAGWAAFLNQNIALEILARYTDTGDIKGIFSIGAGFQIHYHR